MPMPVRTLARLLAVAAVLGLPALAIAQAPSGDAPKGKSDTPQTKPDDKDAGAPAAPKDKPKLEIATFAGGCFWCMEASFEPFNGVKGVVSGYSGGTFPRPTYEDVQTGMTGHAEAIQITYDPSVISYEDLLTVFFVAHDPTTYNRQGPDVGTEYRSVIFYHNEAQKEAALAKYQRLTDSHAFNAPIVTQLVPFKKFWPAERYHQNYFRNHKFAPYCQAEIEPKLAELKRLFGRGIPKDTPAPK